MLNASKFRNRRMFSLGNGMILVKRKSSRYTCGVYRLFACQNGTRWLPPNPSREPVESIPVTGVSVSRTSPLPVGRPEAIVVMLESCQLLATYFANALSPCINVGDHTKEYTNLCR